MATLLLCVAGMRNAEDEARVESALRAQPGVFGAVADYHAGRAEIDCDDDEVDFNEMIELLNAVGFQASLGG